MVEKQLQTNMFPFLMEGFYSFRRFNRSRELIPNCSCSHIESMFANNQLSFRNKRLLQFLMVNVFEQENSLKSCFIVVLYQ